MAVNVFDDLAAHVDQLAKMRFSRQIVIGGQHELCGNRATIDVPARLQNDPPHKMVGGKFFELDRTAGLNHLTIDKMRGIPYGTQDCQRNLTMHFYCDKIVPMAAAFSEIQPGSIVVFRQPNPDELDENGRQIPMRVLEVNGDRAKVEALVDMAIKPTYVHSLDELRFPE
jgi:hypothetical protein